MTCIDNVWLRFFPAVPLLPIRLFTRLHLSRHDTPQQADRSINPQPLHRTRMGLATFTLSDVPRRRCRRTKQEPELLGAGERESGGHGRHPVER